ncbi:hypothetical protein [Nocardioides sp. GY 10127]|uniref:hypothetical protein n=1 Tax=Nocardioides sp. GY 10127 TaxID=2569762 RepID=UPI0010A8D7CC|nr:hypothetical protein [Nocardioides sp. GY 10127]TIC82610.1 hypothetical protein E8D37_07815 [Nocardioides sp. GY 10127]
MTTTQQQLPTAPGEDAAVEGPGSGAGAPRGLGVFPLPQGLLLLGDDAESLAVRANLAAGRVPPVWPSGLAPVAAAHAGDLAGALAAWAPRAGDPLVAFNRWLLDPATAEPNAVRAGLPEDLRPLVDVVAWTIGVPGAEVPAEPTPEQVRSEPEVGALVLATRASAALEQRSPDVACALLGYAAQAADARGPALAAMLRGNTASLLREAGAPAEQVGTLLRRSTDALEGSDLPEVRAELLHELGLCVHERAAEEPRDVERAALMREAMGHYYDALGLVSETSAPELWASVQLDLAAAHLAVPMTQASDQLRLGVAAQSLRACRRVFTPETHPGPWSTATVNLANALVYTPSQHRSENLVEAIGLYQEVVDSGTRDDDAVGRARLLMNLGNALAHAGALDEARAALAEARYLFETELDHEGALTVRGLQDEIARVGVTDPDTDLDDLARQVEAMSRMDAPTSFTSGMGVSIDAGSINLPAGDSVPPPRRVTRVDPSQRPTGRPDAGNGAGTDAR